MPQDDEKGPLVVIDQTQQDGISASEIQRIARDRRERMSREATTSVIEIGRIPKKKSSLPLMVFLAVLGIGIVALIVKSQQEPVVDGVIPPVSAAAVSQQDLSIPPVPTSVTTATDAVTSAAPAQTNATIPLPSAALSNHANANHPAASASPGGDNDPDKALFKTHRTP